MDLRRVPYREDGRVWELARDLLRSDDLPSDGKVSDSLIAVLDTVDKENQSVNKPKIKTLYNQQDPPFRKSTSLPNRTRMIPLFSDPAIRILKEELRDTEVERADLRTKVATQNARILDLEQKLAAATTMNAFLEKRNEKREKMNAVIATALKRAVELKHSPD